PAPATGRIDRARAGHRSADRLICGHHLGVDPGGPALEEAAVRVARQHPVVQALPAVAESVVDRLVRTGDEPVDRDGHVENRPAHEVRPFSWDSFGTDAPPPPGPAAERARTQAMRKAIANAKWTIRK